MGLRIKIFSVRADENFRAIRIGEESHRLSANEYLEREIQQFLDENPKVQIKHIQFSSIPIIPKTAAWNTTNADIDWEIEKSVLILFE
jgi:hypothetical protein